MCFGNLEFSKICFKITSKSNFLHPISNVIFIIFCLNGKQNVVISSNYEIIPKVLKKYFVRKLRNFWISKKKVRNFTHPISDVLFIIFCYIVQLRTNFRSSKKSWKSYFLTRFFKLPDVSKIYKIVKNKYFNFDALNLNIYKARFKVTICIQILVKKIYFLAKMKFRRRFFESREFCTIFRLLNYFLN